MRIRGSDIWAFGCVLFEMLTGHRAFDGDTVSEILASVLKTEPALVRCFQPRPPSAIRQLLRRCLQKDLETPAARLGDARLDLNCAR